MRKRRRRRRRQAVRRIWFSLDDRRFARENAAAEGWKSLDFLGFSRPNWAFSTGYKEFPKKFFGSYSVSCWYGPFPMALLIQFCGRTRALTMSRGCGGRKASAVRLRHGGSWVRRRLASPPSSTDDVGDAGKSVRGHPFALARVVRSVLDVASQKRLSHCSEQRLLGWVATAQR